MKPAENGACQLPPPFSLQWHRSRRPPLSPIDFGKEERHENANSNTRTHPRQSVERYYAVFRNETLGGQYHGLAAAKVLPIAGRSECFSRRRENIVLDGHGNRLHGNIQIP